MRQALHGITVCDLTHALAGPFCTQQLQLLGANVIKVEPPAGDDFRERGSTFAALNGGKRSVVLDLRSEHGLASLRRLVERSDVLVENFRPGVVDKLGIDWSSLSVLNPRLIYCSISGYGQTGPLRDYPAIEWAVQAMSGISASYVDDDADGAYLGVGVLDPFSGYMAFSAILAALLQRHQTGAGQYIDASMLDAALLLMTPSVAGVSFGDRRGGLGRRPTMVRYRAADRRLFVAALHRKWFERLCEIIDAPSLLSDPRFADQSSQAAHADELIEAIEAKLAARPAAEWEQEFVRAGLPAAVVRTLSELLAMPHMAERLAHLGLDFQAPVPRLGEHTAEILAELER